MRPESEASPAAWGRDYPVKRLLEILGGTWTPIILHQLSEGPVRYGKLQRALRPISKKVLTQILKQLASDGLVAREVSQTIPPATEYRLTPLGIRFHRPLSDLCAWAQRHEVDIARIHARRHGKKATGWP